MSPRPCCPAPFTGLRASLDAPILSQSRRAIQHDLLVCKPATRRGHGNLAAEIVRSGARRRRHLAPPRLALPRADRRVDLPHQAVRLVLLLGLWRSLGGLRLSRAGSATGSAVPSITFAASPAIAIATRLQRSATAAAPPSDEPGGSFQPKNLSNAFELITSQQATRFQQA